MNKFFTYLSLNCALAVAAVPDVSLSEAISRFDKAPSAENLLAASIIPPKNEPAFESARAHDLIQLLARMTSYQKAHPKPEETAWKNVAPPCGGIAGQDPKSITDPAQREAYEKAIEKNKALIQKITTFYAIERRIAFAVAEINVLRQTNEAAKQLIDAELRSKA
jgi:hypothetical protein